MYGCVMATRQGFPGTQRLVLAMDSMGFPALPTVVTQRAKRSSAYLVFNEESSGHSHRGCENTF